MDDIKDPGKEAEAKVVPANEKLELWEYSKNLVFKRGENIVCSFFCLVTGV
jgi:hypothetical protein